MKNSQTFRNFEVGEPGSNIKNTFIKFGIGASITNTNIIANGRNDRRKKIFFHDFEPA